MPLHPRYLATVRKFAGLDQASLQSRLDQNLPELWRSDYLAMPGATDNLVVVTLGDETLARHFCRYLFDHARDSCRLQPAPPQKDIAEDRVVAVWGTSRKAGANRDRARVRGFPLGSSLQQDDRGHFFAHSMGGGLDINLFPQASRVNRGGLWRQMESYCARNPGTFCFIRPLYADASWRPTWLEYGIIRKDKGKPFEFWGHLFENR